MSEGVSNVSKSGQGHHAWVFLAQTPGNLKTRKHPVLPSTPRVVSQVRLLLASGYLVTSILSSIWTVKQVRSLPEVSSQSPSSNAFSSGYQYFPLLSFCLPCVQWDTVASISSCLNTVLGSLASGRPSVVRKQAEVSKPSPLYHKHPRKKQFPLRVLSLS